MLKWKKGPDWPVFFPQFLVNILGIRSQHDAKEANESNVETLRKCREKIKADIAKHQKYLNQSIIDIINELFIALTHVINTISGRNGERAKVKNRFSKNKLPVLHHLT